MDENDLPIPQNADQLTSPDKALPTVAPRVPDQPYFGPEPNFGGEVGTLEKPRLTPMFHKIGATPEPWAFGPEPAWAAEKATNPFGMETPEGVTAPTAPHQGPAIAPVRPANTSSVLFGHGQAETVAGYAAAGLNRGVRGLGGSMVSLVGLGIGKLEDQAGRVNNRLSDAFFQWADQIEKGGPKTQINTISDLQLRDPMGWMKYAAEAMGEAVPFVGSLLAGGAGARGIAYLAAKRGAPSAVQRTLLRTMPEFLTKAENVGALMTGIGIETGITAKQVFDLTHETRALPSILAGTVKGFIDLPMTMLASRALGITEGVAQSLSKEVLRTSLTGGAGMVGRDIVNMTTQEHYGAKPIRGEELAGHLLDAFAKGAIPGVALPGIERARQPKQIEHTGEPTPDEIKAVADEMPNPLVTDSASPVSIDPVTMAREVQDGVFGLQSLTAQHHIDEALSVTDGRAGDYLYAVTAKPSDLSYGFMGDNNMPLSHLEGNPLTSERDSIALSPKDTTELKDLLKIRKLDPKAAVKRTDDGISVVTPEGDVLAEFGHSRLEQSGSVLTFTKAEGLKQFVRAGDELRNKGTDVTFGSRDYAVQEGKRRGENTHVQLRKDLVRRSDVTSGIEDMPVKMSDPRVQFLDPAQKVEAARSLGAAMKMKERAITLRDDPMSKHYLYAAEQLYRRAIQQGVRVEPLKHGTIRLRDESKYQLLTEPVSGIRSSVTRALLTGGKKLGGIRKKLGMEWTQLDNTNTYHQLTIKNDNGENVATLKLQQSPDGKGVYVADAMGKYGNKLSNAEWRDILGEVKKKFPSAEQLAGFRISGARMKGKPLASGANTATLDLTKVRENPEKPLYPYFSPKGIEVQQNPGSRKLGGAFEKANALRNKALDLDTVDAKDVTAIPSDLHYRQLLENQRVFRGYDTRLAERIGIDTGGSKQLLQQFVKFMVTHAPGVPLSEARMTQYLKMVENGLRLRVDPQTESFIMLKELNARQLVDIGERDTVAYQGAGLMSKPRFGEFKVNRTLRYQDGTLKNIYLRSLRGTWIQTALSGYVRGHAERKNSGSAHSTTNITPDPADSLGGPIERILKPLGIKDKVQIKVVSPKVQEEGIVLQRATVEGEKATIIQINPWAYAEDSTRTTKKGVELGKDKSASKDMDKAGDYGISTTAQVSTDGHMAKFWSDLGNSLGHLIYMQEFGKLSEAQKATLREAFNREMFDLRGLDLEVKVARTVAHPLVADTVNGIVKSSGNYNLDFETWLALGMGRLFSTEPRVLDQVPSLNVRDTKGKIFGRMVDGIKRFMNYLTSSEYTRKLTPEDAAAHDRIVKAIQADALSGRPNPAITDFITSLEKRFKETGEPLLEDEARISALESRAAGQEALEGIGVRNIVAEPASATSLQLRTIMKLLDPKKDGAAVSTIKGLLALNDKFGFVMKRLLGIHELAKANPHIPGVKLYLALVNAMQNRRSEWTSLADERVRQIMSLGKDQAERLYRFLFDYDGMSYLNQKDLRSGKVRPRRPTMEELQDLVKQHGLSRETLGVFSHINRDFLQFIGDMEQVTIDKIKRTVSDPEEQRLQIATVNQETASLRYRPYFPHMRFGDFITTVRARKNDDVMHFEAFHTKADRDAASIELQRQYPIKEFSHENDILSDVAKQYQGIPRYALNAVLEELGLDKPILSTEERRDKRALEALAISADRLTSFRRRMVGRKGTPGFSMDGLRAYAAYFTQSAPFLARQEFSDRMQGAIKDVYDSGQLAERDTRTQIGDHMQQHFDYVSKGGAELGTVRGLTYMWYLGFVPVSAFINMTQVPLASFPHLAAKFGDLAAPRSLAGAFVKNLKVKVDQYRKGVVPDEGILTEAIEQANVDRVLQDGLATELAAAAGGSTLARLLPGTKAERSMRQVANAASWMFSTVEKMNRHVTFRSAFDLALRHNDADYVNEVASREAASIQKLQTEKGWTEQQARAYVTAVDAVNATQFQYSKTYRPKIAQGQFGTLVFLLKNYNMNMANLAFRGDRGTVVRFWLTMAVAGGLMGLPGAEDTTKLIKAVAEAMGYRIDFEREIRELMTSIGAGKGSDYVLHGASRSAFGLPWATRQLGIPSPEFDLSKNLSLGRLVPGLSAGVDASHSQSKSEFLGKITEDILGPAFGVPWNIYQAMTDHTLASDDPKRWERALPRAIRGMARASRFLGEGMERNRKGNAIAPIDVTDPQDYMEVIMQGLGFSPTRINQIYDLKAAQADELQYWQGRRKDLSSKFYIAIKNKDAEAKEDTLKAIREFNAEVPHPEMAIKSQGLRKGVTQNVRTRVFEEEHQLPQKSVRRLGEDIKGLYPEVKIIEQKYVQ